MRYVHEILDPRAVLLNGGAGALERFWRIDQAKITLISGGRAFSELALEEGQDGLTRLRQALPHSSFHLTLLGAGEYYPSMARPNSCTRPEDSPGRNPDPDVDRSIQRGRALSSGQLDALIEQFKDICQTVHPEAGNLNAFGHDIRNLLILACTEVEAQWKNILTSNSYSRSERMNIRDDYAKLLAAMKLNEYQVELTWYPWIGTVSPFEAWATNGSLPWYRDYNKVKHDRITNFGRATLSNAMDAVAGCFVMLCAQYGWDFARRGHEASSAFFRLIRGPAWRPEEVYVPGLPRQVNYNFTLP